MSEDAYKGDAQFTVAVDGIQLAGTFTATALHSAGASQSFTFKGDWGVGSHTVTVNCSTICTPGRPPPIATSIWTPSATTGRIPVRARRSWALFRTTSRSPTPRRYRALPSCRLRSALAAAPILSSSICREDAYKGDAQFTVSVDGRQLGGTFTTAALHAAGQSQSFTFKGDFGQVSTRSR